MSIKQSHKETFMLGDGSSESLPACWQRERDRECLRIKTHPGELFLLPYQQFVCAHFKEAEGKEVLTVAFASHCLTIEGHHLEEIVSALQEFSVDWISPMPTRFQGLRNGFSATVLNVEVEAVD